MNKVKLSALRTLKTAHSCGVFTRRELPAIIGDPEWYRVIALFPLVNHRRRFDFAALKMKLIPDGKILVERKVKIDIAVFPCCPDEAVVVIGLRHDFDREYQFHV
jgi:hypothetical protein